MKRVLAITALAVVLTLLPSNGVSWGTFTSPIKLPPGKIKDLKWLVGLSPGRPELVNQVVQRLGPHPIHQFIMLQAYKLLEDDPAFKDGQSGLPSLREVNAWDGLERPDVSPAQRTSSPFTGPCEILAPTVANVRGPSPDAEIEADGKTWNPLYNGGAHYWNPWLQVGGAPEAAGACYAELTNGILKQIDANTKAKLVAYLGHYIADASAPKHADQIVFQSSDVQQLMQIANAWVGEISDDERAWLASPQIQKAKAIMEARVRAINPSQADNYWLRIRQHMTTDAPLKPYRSVLVDISYQSLESSIGCYLWELSHRPPKREVMPFYGYYDPLYYNGPMYNAAGDYPSLELGVPLGHHLMSETDPAQFEFVKSAVESNLKMVTDSLPRLYPDMKPQGDYFSLDDQKRTDGMKLYASNLTKECAKIHGPDFDESEDFSGNWEGYMRNSIRYVYDALRASISALRIQAKYSEAGKDTYRLRVTIQNPAEEPVTLSTLRILTKRGSEVLSSDGWDWSMDGKKLGAGESTKMTLEVGSVPKEGPEPVLYAEIRGKYDRIPDCGVRRTLATKRGNVEIKRNPGAGDMNAEKGPVDLAIVFDTTQSMTSCIASMQANAIEIVRKLRSQSSDMRLAICSFRDLGADGEGAVEAKPFTRNIDGYIGEIGGWKALGGGDPSEDQLAGIKTILDMWKAEGSPTRKPAKIIVVITDAAAKSPDRFGNTFKSIAELAEQVDPAHIYPVIVGDTKEAMDDAQELANSTGGKVVSSTDYGKASDMMLEAVGSAVSTYSSPTEEDDGPTGIPKSAYWAAAVFVLGAIGYFRAVSGRLG